MADFLSTKFEVSRQVQQKTKENRKIKLDKEIKKAEREEQKKNK